MHGWLRLKRRGYLFLILAIILLMISTQSVPLIATYHKSSNSLNENQGKELQMISAEASIATQESNFPVVYSESINIDEFKIDVDNSSPMKMMNRPEIPEDENGTVPVDVFISDDEYYIVGAEKEVLDAMVQQSERRGSTQYCQMMRPPLKCL